MLAQPWGAASQPTGSEKMRLDKTATIAAAAARTTAKKKAEKQRRERERERKRGEGELRKSHGVGRYIARARLLYCASSSRAPLFKPFESVVISVSLSLS